MTTVTDPDTCQICGRHLAAGAKTTTLPDGRTVHKRCAREAGRRQQGGGTRPTPPPGPGPDRDA